MTPNIFFFFMLFCRLLQGCQHDTMEPIKPVKGYQDYTTHQRSSRDAIQVSGWEPIRITFDTSFVDQQTTSLYSTRNYVSNLLSLAKSRFKDILKVQPITGNLFVPRNCTAAWTAGPNAGQCAQASTANQCAEVNNIPAEHLAALTLYPSTGSQIYIPGGVGIPNSDLLIYVTINTTSRCAENVIAYATACHLDQMDRPVVGGCIFARMRSPVHRPKAD
jgi:hypothetical protein